MTNIRKNTKPINIGDVQVGGNSPISVQSMTKTPTTDVEKTLKEFQQGSLLKRQGKPEEIAKAVDFGLSSPLPPEETLYDDVYVNYPNDLRGLR